MSVWGALRLLAEATAVGFIVFLVLVALAPVTSDEQVSGGKFVAAISAAAWSALLFVGLML